MNASGDVALSLAEFVVRLRGRVVPMSTTETAVRCVLDAVAAAAAGYSVPAAEATRALALRSFRDGDAAVWFSGQRRTVAGAALANSAAASALDIDDGHRAASGHPGAAVIPAAIAVAEEVGATGTELLTAIVAGYEVGVRVAASRDVASVDTFASGRWCAYGAAAAAGYLRKSSREHLAQAFVIAAAHSPGLAAVAYTKHSGNAVKEGIPWATLVGLAALDLATEGFTGPADALDAGSGFDRRVLLEGLGDTFAIGRVYFKRYACCRWFHAGIDALLDLRREFRLAPADIERIRVETFGRALTLNNATRPWSLEAAQYSYPFCLAVASHDGANGLLPLTDDHLRRAELAEFATRVELTVDPGLDALFPAQTAARLVIRTKSGTHVRTVESPKGDPANPLSPEDLRVKFGRLTAAVWSPAERDQAFAAILAIPDNAELRVRDLLRG